MPGLGWSRAVISELTKEQAQLELPDHGLTTIAAVRLLKPLTDLVCEADWLCFKIKIANIVPDSFKWSKDIVDRMEAFNMNADRFSVQVRLSLYHLSLDIRVMQVSSPTEAAQHWEGELFFYLDIVPPAGPARTHRIRASRILGKPRLP